MALRLVEMVCPEEKRDEVQELVAEFEPIGVWHDRFLDDQVVVRVLLEAEKAEPVLDRLESRYSGMEGFHVLLMAVEAAIPRASEEPGEDKSAAGAPDHTAVAAAPSRVSRHELYDNVAASADVTRIYLALICLSTLVAAIGLWRDNVAVVIGAMVIAPLLGPNMALAFATTLGDGELGRRALRTTAVGVAVAVALAVVLGVLLHADPSTAELAGRSEVRLADVVLALAAGAAGALAFTTGVHTPLVGVMVAVALLPPLAASGLLLGTGAVREAGQAFLLFLANLISINLAGVVTFQLRGIRPRTWWEAGRARRASRLALALWVLLLVMLVAVIVISRRGGSALPEPPPTDVPVRHAQL
jgi:uncharacterized hydrophobic protein (TIGR00341 family)